MLLVCWNGTLWFTPRMTLTKLANTKIKICGITNASDTDFAVLNGVDALGFNLFPKSRRHIELDKAQSLASRLPDSVLSFALLVNPEESFVREVVDKGAFDLLQFHGDESNEFCASFNVPFVKALRVGRVSNLAEEIAKYKDSRWILLDAFVEGQYGGTGQTIDWQALSLNLQKVSKKVLLAGGLNPSNVQQAIKSVQPFAVDVSGGVEASAGIKDHNKITEFIQQVRLADSEVQS